MRRKIPYRVCHCTPDGVVTHLEARLLRDIVNRAIHPIRCAESCKRKYQKAMYIGDLCAETGHFLWALKVWSFTAYLIESKDYDDWRYVWFDNNRVRLTDVISETEYELLVYLMENKNIALSRDKLLQDIWGYDFFGDDRTIDTHIKNLRGRLGDYRDKIATVRGIGYKFED